MIVRLFVASSLMVSVSATCTIPNVAGASISGTGCVEGGVIGLSDTCSWEQEAGYTCTGVGLSTCIVNGPLPTPTCIQNFCNAYFFTGGIISDPSSSVFCTDGDILTVLSRPTCGLMCDTSAGYTAGTAPLTCPFPGGVTVDNGGSDAPIDDLPFSSADAITALECVPVPCPDHASSVSVGVCVCDNGYEGSIAYTGTSYTGTCTEIQCAMFAFPAGIVGATCADGVTSAITNPMCPVKCDTGYVLQESNVICNADTRIASMIPPLTCVEKQCTTYVFPAGVVGNTANTNPCTTARLTTVTTPRCGIACDTGYSGSPIELVCPETTANGALPVGNIVCVENKCAAITLGTGVVGVAPNGCINGLRLGAHTNSMCDVKCDVGYVTQTGSMNCAANIVDGSAATGSITCTPTCALHTCGTGYRPLSPTTECAVSGCITAACCVLVDCPANASPSTNPSMCPCDTGFSGNSFWDPSTTTWTHTCTATCANAAFPGCTSGTSLRLSPEAVLCTGTGTPALACTQAGCCVENVCLPPGERFPAYHFGGGVACTTAEGCGRISCATGYIGTPTVECTVSGNDFTFPNACTAAPCPANAAGAGVCACDPGFAVPNGGSTQWNVENSMWDHSCQLSCAHSSFTGCNVAGLILRENPESVFCTGTGGNPALDCTASVCCIPTCENYNACPTTGGFAKKANPALIGCSDPSGCSSTVCCAATCDNEAFSGCGNGFRPVASPSTTRCDTFAATSCNTNTCCIPTTCANVVCSSGLRASPTAPATCDTCTEAICCVENTCRPLSFSTGYASTTGSMCTTVSGCGSFSCASGYRSTGTVIVTCPVEGAMFDAQGCSENICNAVVIAGYVTEGSCTMVSQCGSVGCTSGYNRGQSIPQFRCPVNGGDMTATGCSLNECIPPVTSNGGLMGYSLSGSNTCTTVATCGIVACSTGYSPTTGATPSISCATPNDIFRGSGCQLNICTAPQNVPAGYVIGNSNCVTADQCGTITCADRYQAVATPSASCPVSGGSFTFSGCEIAPCPSNSISSTSGCVCVEGYVGTPIWDSQSNTWSPCQAAACPPNSAGAGVCSCSQGYIGTASWTGTSWGHTCSAVACPANSSPEGVCSCNNDFTGTPTWVVDRWTHTCNAVTTCNSMGTIPAGYSVAGAPCTSIAGCGAVTCSTGYIPSNPRIICQNNVLVPVGCVTAVCPTNSGPVGVCACTSPFVGVPAWTGTAWTHTCNQVNPTSCPSNAVFVSGTCQCIIGYSGTLQIVGGQWTGTCTAATCPAFSSGPGTCLCNAEFTGVPNWDSATSSWAHSCSRVACSGSQCITRTNLIKIVTDAKYTSTGYVTNLVGDTTTSCTAANAALFQEQPTITSAGQLSLRAAGEAGTTTVTCTATTVGSAVGIPFTFDVQVSPRSRYSRCEVATPIANFIASSFIRALLNILNTPTRVTRIFRIIIYYACPRSACLVNGQIRCPNVHSQRLARGCRSDFTNARDWMVLQDTTGEASIVDFDMTVDEQGTLVTDQERVDATTQVNTAIDDCSVNPTTCEFAKQGIPIVPGTTISTIQNVATLAPGTPNTPTPAPLVPSVVTTGGSDDLDWWVITLIAIGILLFCVGLIVACACMKQKNQNENDSMEENGTVIGRGVYDRKSDMSASNPSYYPSYQSSDLNKSFDTPDKLINQSEQFTPGDKVSATYVDGKAYDAEVKEVSPDGTYGLLWDDGSYSVGVPSVHISPRR